MLSFADTNSRQVYPDIMCVLLWENAVWEHGGEGSFFSQNSVSQKLVILTVIHSRCSAGVSRYSSVAEVSTTFPSVASGVLWI